MTGNVVFIGFSLDPASGLSAVASTVAIAGFVLGALLGGRIAHRLESRTAHWLLIAFGLEAALTGLVAVLVAVGLLPFEGPGRHVTVVLLAIAMGVQNATVRHLGVPDLTTTVLTLTMTGLSADSALGGGPGGRPHRRLAAILAMLAGAGLGALLAQHSAAAVLGLCAVLVAVVAGAFGSRSARPEVGAETDRH
jgi:uncharacterized membrane protein YoaK (UPF0700 family)